MSHLYSKSNAVNENGKPAIIPYYNEYKGGVDSSDQLCHLFIVSRKSKHWSIRIFFWMLDMTAISVYYSKVKNAGRNVKILLKDLYMHFWKDCLLDSFNISFLQIDLLLGIKCILGLDAVQMNFLKLLYMKSNNDVWYVNVWKTGKLKFNVPHAFSVLVTSKHLIIFFM